MRDAINDEALDRIFRSARTTVRGPCDLVNWGRSRNPRLSFEDAGHFA